jgi:hypothetical protein
VLTAVTASQTQLATASTSPYQSGYNHGCSDARISDPSDQYINEPGKGPSFHTPAFMNGYYAGFNACSGGGGSGGNSGGSTFADGNSAGKRQGESDALNGRPFDDRCSGPTNDYCLGYKVGYGIEYRLTKILRDK